MLIWLKHMQSGSMWCRLGFLWITLSGNTVSWADGFVFSAPDCGTNPGWRKNNNICYYYNDTDIVDFHTAVSRCYAEKASLVSILNQNEQAYVNSMVCLLLSSLH